MKFGSDEFFEYLGMGLQAEPWPEDLVDTVVRVLYQDLEKYRSGRSRYRDYLNDADEMIDNVVIRVVSHLPDIYEKCCFRTENERNGYLIRMIENEFKSLIRSRNREPQPADLYGYPDADPSDSEDERLSGAVYDQGSAVRSIEEGLFEDEENRRALFRVTEQIFGLRTAYPEILIAFLVNRILAEFELNRRNGSPEQVRKAFRGKSLFQARDVLLAIYRELVSPAEVPEAVFRELDRKLNDPDGEKRVGDRIFELSEKQIKDGATWIGRKIRKNDRREE